MAREYSETILISCNPQFASLAKGQARDRGTCSRRQRSSACANTRDMACGNHSADSGNDLVEKKILQKRGDPDCTHRWSRHTRSRHPSTSACISIDLSTPHVASKADDLARLTRGLCLRIRAVVTTWTTTGLDVETSS